MNALQYILENRNEVLTLTLEHLWMVVASTLLAVVVGIPLGILITRRPSLDKPVLGTANVIQTIPSLALFEAGRGMGMTDRQILWQVEFPLALGVIIAGVRVATVISVGLATIAAAIGAGGLGEFIFRGLAMVNNQLILAGALPAAILALLADVSLGWLERRLSPR